MLSGLGKRGHASRGPHHERLGQPRFRRPGGERLEVTRGDRPEVGIDRGRRRALVLPELWRDLVRGDHVHSR